VDLMQREVPAMREIDLLKTGYFDLPPGGFCLAATAARFFLPDDVAAEVKMRSSLARAGLDHALAGWADPGWHGSVLTLELVNNLRYHSLRLRPGLKIAQMIFWKGEPVPAHASYAARGRYNNDTQVQPSKGVEA
jgi:dCTP deaminase